MDNSLEKNEVITEEEPFMITPMSKDKRPKKDKTSSSGESDDTRQNGDSPSVNKPEITIVDISMLIPFENHPFKPYEGQRFTDMVASIRAQGILEPIIVRPYSEEGKYEILAGHNRVAAAKEAELIKVPVIIRAGLSEEEALIVVTETNLIQRSFADLTHSERAIALTTHYDAIKKNPGFRSDLLAEIDELSEAPLGHGTKTRDKVGAHYGLGKTTVARYLRVNKLIMQLKERLDREDGNGIGMRVAEALSFLKIKDQKIVEGLLAGGKKISIALADELKKESETGTLGEAKIKNMFEQGNTPSKTKPIKLSGKFLSKHFKPEQSTKEIEDIIAKALEYYLSSESND